MSTKKGFVIRTDDPIKAYLSLLGFAINLSPKELSITASVIKAGGVFTKEVKLQLREEYKLTAKHIAQYIFLLQKKDVVVQGPEGFRISDKLMIKDEGLTLTINVVKT